MLQQRQQRQLNWRRWIALAGLSAAAAGALILPGAGCNTEKAQAVAPPPTDVTVSKPAEQKVSDFVEFTGTTDAFESVDVRARVKGFLKKTYFSDGAYVKKDEMLFEIEPDIFQALVDKATAMLEAAKARLAKADADLKIKQEMAAGNAASKLDVIQAEAAVQTAKADVSGATAALEQAKIDLGYCKITAPISGRIDRARVSDGNLVGADGNTLLANIVAFDPIYVYFDVDEPTVQRFQARMRGQKVEPGSSDHPKIPMQMALGNSTDFKYSGFIDYTDNKVDPNTGTIRVRATIPNPNRELLTGFFGRVRVPDGEPYEATLIPERAIGVDQGQKYVLVVKDKNVVEQRPIEVGSQQGTMRVVKKGLTPEEWVITQGVLRTRPGATVAPQQKPLEMTPGATPASQPVARL